MAENNEQKPKSLLDSIVNKMQEDGRLGQQDYDVDAPVESAVPPVTSENEIVDPITDRHAVVPENNVFKEKKKIIKEEELPQDVIPILSGNFPSDEESLKILEEESQKRSKNRASEEEKQVTEEVEPLESSVSDDTSEISVVSEDEEDAPIDSLDWYDEEDEEATSSKSLLFPIVAVLAILGLAGGLWAFRDHLKPQSAPTPTVTPTSAPTSLAPQPVPTTGTFGVADLKKGQCIANWADANDNNAKYNVVDCTQPHNAQVFYVESSLDLGQAGYPGDAGAATAVQQVCQVQADQSKKPEFDFNTLGISSYWTHPNADSYNAGDRKAACFFVSSNPVPMIASVVK